MISGALESKEYSPGMRVIIRNEEWMIKKVENNSIGKKALYCKGISPLVKDREAIFLADLEKIEIINPAEIKLVCDNSPNFKKSRLYIESNWRQKAPTDNELHIGNKAAMDVLNYQLVPASIALKQIRQRILLADSTGLGKTLEAGILMSELILRGKGKRILVVSSKSMMTQFQKEMWNRFSIPLVRLDSTKIHKIREDLPSNYNPFFYYDKTIISIDTLKRDIEYRTHLEKAFWDIIVIDEAQNVAQRSGHSQRSKLAELLAQRSDTLIMLSATPHDGRPESFASLMNMLNPTAIANPIDYTTEDIKGLCVRRFKNDIKDEIVSRFQEREVHSIKINATQQEEKVFNIFSNMNLSMDNNKKNHSKDLLFKTIIEKALFSSPAACLKTINERIHKLENKHDKSDDIDKLNELKSAIENINPDNFSRYTALLNLLKSSEYNWNVKNTKDRIVIFTERIETMKYLINGLREDLNLSAEVQELYGGMNDVEQQRIVDEFSREDSRIRILVASDVASEGINLHYLSHRLIHFDIPWSLMVFQQRNGRIDRYGQTEKPDIRYFLINSSNNKIKGDTRTMEILIEKEQQAYKNIGDPAMLLGKNDVSEEELIVGKAIENNVSESDFLSNFNPFETLLQEVSNDKQTIVPIEDKTLFNDISYLETAIGYFAQTESFQARKLSTVNGIELQISPSLERRLNALLPREIMRGKSNITLSPDKEFCMQEMKKCMQNSLTETAWPETQYLWKIHPIFDWINDKTSIIYKRNEAPLIFLSNNSIAYKEFIFIVSGIIPNRKATPLINEWFGLHYVNNKFDKIYSMDEVIKKTNIDKDDNPNINVFDQASLDLAQDLLAEVIQKSKEEMSKKCIAYNKDIDPKIYQEIENLDNLRQKRKDYQLSLFENDRKRNEKERQIDALFNDYIDWVKDTLEIEDNPYLKVIAVITGV